MNSASTEGLTAHQQPKPHTHVDVVTQPPAAFSAQAPGLLVDRGRSADGLGSVTSRAKPGRRAEGRAGGRPGADGAQGLGSAFSRPQTSQAWVMPHATGRVAPSPGSWPATGCPGRGAPPGLLGPLSLLATRRSQEAARCREGQETCPASPAADPPRPDQLQPALEPGHRHTLTTPVGPTGGWIPALATLHGCVVAEDSNAAAEERAGPGGTGAAARSVPGSRQVRVGARAAASGSNWELLDMEQTRRPANE